MLRSIFRTVTPVVSTFRTASSSLAGRRICTRFVTPVRLYSSESVDKNEITTRVIDVIKAFDKTAASKEVSPQTAFHKDLGLDSLDTVELLVAIEEEFDIEIPDKVADELKSVGETVEYIASNPEAH
ncbi:hypothetical protein HG535_0B06950 [Zygotorulaspora mrakii]|uniref:Acyl carrier protein n=1 Tax=Zygotorulaspora mrakii TaxID=42260 RepID=A0A7H9B102_ZYGMR|nr:uncharacterized protein HG535_0B06950 [Zygotorulaspora mrakii]QLG71649.1 hypothetical protein HG535_0B06950 [Zygotorulaspora mrakii]